MTTAAIDYTYDYAFASRVDDDRIELATCGGALQGDEFFRGRLRHPHVVGGLLSVLSTVVRTHFIQPRPGDLDPVITSSPAMLRFEGFSGCCGVYARVDLDERAFRSSQQAYGTTNVDFNDSMRRELARLRTGQEVEFSVGRESFEVRRDAASVTERKVKLPIRWIKGFSETQAYQPRLVRRLEVAAGDLRRVFRNLPRGTRQLTYVVPSGKSIRLSQRSTPTGVPISGTDRLRVIEPLLPHADQLVVWCDPESGVSGWELLTTTGSFFLLLSPGLYRGFSGEGQVLERLAGEQSRAAVADVQKLLNWQTTLDPAEIAARTGHRVAQVENALAVLGARGLTGFDASKGYYFHRQLPFDIGKVEQFQPRLRAARKLLDEDKVRVLKSPENGNWDVEVQGTGVAHLVRLRPDGDRCTCPWFSKHQGTRGPCKHVLAARIFIERSERPA